MQKFKALDLFCGVGGSSWGLAKAGFHVTGVDIEPQPSYPFDFVLADALQIDLSDFDFIWASPPCQKYCWANYKIYRDQHPDLLDPTYQKLISETKDQFWVIENVMSAEISGLDPAIIYARDFGLPIIRGRKFWSNFYIWETPKRNNPENFITVTGKSKGNVELKSLLMGIPFDKLMTQQSIANAVAVPVAYYIGKQALNQIMRNFIDPMTSYKMKSCLGVRIFDSKKYQSWINLQNVTSTWSLPGRLQNEIRSSKLTFQVHNG